MPATASFSELVVGHTAPVLAHQGGWDEILMVLVPVAIFAVLLYVANRRAGGLAARDDAEEADGTPPPPRSAPRNPRAGPS
ncbi:MAG: hypothetical protein ACYC2O_06105 [Microthrixaceae bacterium]